MIVRWWPRNPDIRVASTRIRCVAIMRALAKRGVDAGIFSAGDNPDVLILLKRYDKESIAVARGLQSKGTVVVLDLCDNHFHADQHNSVSIERAALLAAAVAAADVVCASTPTLARMIVEQCPGVAVQVIGDAVEAPFVPTLQSRFASPLAEARLAWLAQKFRRSEGQVRLLWFGNHGSAHAAGGMLDLLALREPLARLAGSTRQAGHSGVSLTIVSNSAAKFRAVRRAMPLECRYLPWHEKTFSRVARLHHIALIPVGLNPFTACKTNNRLATALVHGLAVAADRVPSYLEFSDGAVLDDWGAGLDRLVADEGYRREMTRRGRTRLADWTLDKVSDQWLTFLRALTPAG